MAKILDMANPENRKTCFWKNFVVIGIIPTFLLLSCWSILSKHTKETQKRKVLSSGRREVREIRREGVDNAYLQGRLNKIYSEIAEDGFNKEKLAEISVEWQSGVLKFINLKFFDAAGRQIKIPGTEDRERVVSGKIFQALINAESTGNESLLLQYRPFFESFAGGIIPQEIVREKSVLLKVMRNGSPAYLYWNSFYDHGGSGRLLGGMLAAFSAADIPEFAGVKLMVAEKSAESEWQFGVVHSDKVSSISMRIASMQKDFIYEMEEGGRFFIIEPFESGLVIFGMVSNEDYFLKKIDVFLKIMAMFWFVIALRLSFEIASENFEMTEKKRQKIVFSAYVFPLLLASATGYSFIQVKNQQQISNVRESLEAMVESVDESYEIAVNKLESLYDRIRQHNYLRNLDMKKLANLSSYLVDRDAFQRIFVVDPDGEIRFGWPSQKNDDDLVKKLIPAVARRIYSMHLGVEPNLKNRLNDMMVDKMTDGFSEVLGDLKSGLYDNFENLNRINEIWLGSNRYYVYAGFIESAGEKRPNLLLLWHKTNSFARRYLTRQVRRNLATIESNLPIRLAMMPRRLDETPFPPELTKYSFSRSLSERVNKTGSRQFSIEEKDGERWLVLAHPMKRVPDRILFAMYPFSKIEKEISLLIIQFILILAGTTIILWRATKIAI